MVRFIFLVLSLTVFAAVGSAQSIPANTGPERQKPVVNIQEQPGAPLKISSAMTKWATPDQQILEIYVVVENVGEQEIRSYAWRIGTPDGSENKDACFIYNIQSPGKILKPGDSDGRSTWRRIPLDSPSLNIDLSVDSADLSNGTWGLDSCRSSDRLSGLRAGALAAKDKFTNIQDPDRGRGILNLLKAGTPVIEVPDGHSPLWAEGFRDGVRMLFEKLRMANEQGGLPEVERALQLPFDASGR